MFEWFRKKLFLFRWGSVAKKWPLERFLPTTDLDLSPAERRELTAGIYEWRNLIPWYFLRHKSCDGDKQIYCFGVAHGSTVEGLVAGLRNRNMDIPHMHLFDSFQGLPKEEKGVAIPAVWVEGAFGAPRTKLEQAIKTISLPQDNFSIHEGWFKDTLQADLVKNGTFKPAAYVDVDADLYNSTMDILDFMFAHKLIGPGTLIGYDDWGDTDLWTAGESRAHKEILAKYDVECTQLFSWGEEPSIRKLFLVVSVADS